MEGKQDEKSAASPENMLGIMEIGFRSQQKNFIAPT
jgi:hypothetical protein